MRELTDDPIYRILDEQYPKMLLDYVLLSDEGAPAGKEGHKAAVLAALRVLDARERVGNSLRHPPMTVEPEKMHGAAESSETLFAVADHGRTGGNLPLEKTYWEAYMYQPYPHPYGIAGFEKINAVLFPVQSRKQLTVRRWSGDFSNYFDQGNAWWGTMLLSVHDPKLCRFVIIGASMTD